MRKIKVITDSCSDLTPDLMEKYDIDYAQMNTVYEGKNKPADLSWREDEVEAFYKILRDGNRITTTQVPMEEFNRVFRKYLDQDMDIVYVSCSNKQSGSINTAHVLAEKLMKEYEGSKISCIDSLNACMGEGLVAIEAAKCVQEGKTIEEVTEYTISIRKKVIQYITVHSLDALRRAGRVTASSAFFGNLLGVKPILISDADGVQAAFKKAKGRAGSFKEVVALLAENIVDAENQTVYIVNANCSKEEIESLKSLIKESINCKDIYVSTIGPIIGASIGPDAIGVYAFGKEVTFRIGEK